MGDASLRLIIGRNGSGKSAFLEAIALIFTRIFQDESPGFNFEVVYSITVNNEDVEVSVSLNDFLGAAQFNEDGQMDNVKKQRLKITVNKNGNKEEYYSFNEIFEYQPQRLIVYSSGPNSIMNEIINFSPLTSLCSDIYDASEGVQANKSIRIREEEIKSSIDLIEKLTNTPRSIFINEDTAKLVLVALFSVIPGQVHGQHELTEQQKRYYLLRDKLTKNISIGISPVAFSLIVDEKRLGEIRNSKGKRKPHASFMELVYSQKEAGEMGGECLNDWVRERNVYSPNDSEDLNLGEKEIQREIVSSFRLNSSFQEQNFYHSSKLDAKWNPVSLLTILLSAKNDGLLKNVHIAFKNNSCDELLPENALSDGEYLWLARMGLLLMVQDQNVTNSIFLLDEPDVHLNESWNAELINLIHEMVSVSNNRDHELLIATHSSLLLTDIDPDQIYHFDLKENRVELKNDEISTFAANRADILKEIFGVNSSIGGYSQNYIDQKINNAERSEEIKAILGKVGPGYHRFQLLERLFELKNQEAGKGD